MRSSSYSLKAKSRAYGFAPGFVTGTIVIPKLQFVSFLEQHRSQLMKDMVELGHHAVLERFLEKIDTTNLVDAAK